MQKKKVVGSRGEGMEGKHETFWRITDAEV